MEQLALNLPEWTIVAEAELIYKTKVKASERPKITSSKDIYEVLKQIWDENKMEMQEQFKVIFLNRANRVIGIYEASSGGLTGTVSDPRLILAAAIKSLAVSVITQSSFRKFKIQQG